MDQFSWKVGDTLRLRNTEPVRIEDIMMGGWGIVYIAINPTTNEKLAIKTIQELHLKDELVVRRFIQEAHLWINLDTHPNIVNAKFIDILYGRPCLLMEYIEGGSLRFQLKPIEPLPLEKAIQFAFQLAKGMSFVWKTHKIVHRDLKPENLLLTKSGQLKITDFGLAQALGISGTPPYMAPEQFRSSQIDTQADIYAFGLILYEMLTGKIPHVRPGLRKWKKEDYEIVMKRRTQEPVPDPRQWNSDIPYEIINLILDCLKTEAAARPNDFEQLCKCLEPMVSDSITNDIVGDFSFSSYLIEAIMGEGAARIMELARKGASLANLGRIEEALSLYDQVLSINDQISEIWKNKSTALLKLDRYEEALACSERAIELGKLIAKRTGNTKSEEIDLMSWTNKIAALSQMKRYQEALAACDEALKLDPNFPRFWNNKGAVLLHLNRLNDALKCAERALEIDSFYDKALFLKGQILYNLGKSKEALIAFENLLSINPRDVNVLLYKAFCLMEREKGNQDQIDELIKTVKKIAPKEFKKFTRNFISRYIGKMDKRDNSASTSNLLDKGNLYVEGGMYNQAIGCYKKIIDADPLNVEGLNNLGNCLYELGKRHEAFPYFKKALEINPKHTYALLNMSRFYIDSKDFAIALVYANRAIETDLKKENDMAWNNRGLALVQLGQDYEAIKNFEQALKINSNNIFAWHNLGNLRFSLGDKSGAKTCFLEALNLNPDLEPARQMLKLCD